MSTKDLTIEQKLLAISNEIHHIEKDSTNKFHHYDYVSANKLFEKIKPMLAEYGLIVFPSCNSCIEADGLTTIMMNYKIVDTTNEQVQDFIIPGQGADKGDKGVYKAMTGALKYFLLQLFMISTDDDPETDDDHRQDRDSKAKPKAPRNSKVEKTNKKSPEENPWTWRIECADNRGFDKPLFNFELSDLLAGLEEDPDKFTKNDASLIRECKRYPNLQEAAKVIWQTRAATVQSQEFDKDHVPY